MALEQFYGRIVDLVRRNDGDELTAAAGIAATVLSIGDTADFDETGGTVEINGDRYTYSTLDHDANTITLDTGLLVATAVGDRVDVVDDELDEVVVEYVANVLLEDQDPGDRPIEVTVNHGLVNYLAEQVRGGFTESVTLIRDGDDDLVIWQVDGKLVVDIALEEVKGGYGGTLQDIYDAADQAAADAADAAANATTAQQSANGKNKVTYSLSTPGSTANTAGDIWFQKESATQTIIGQWEGLGGTSWSAKTIANAVIANLDAGKLTAGSAFINGLSVKTNFTLGDASTNGVIQSYNFSSSPVGVFLDKNGIVAKGGSIAGATITGGTVTGGTVQTSSADSTGIKMDGTNGFRAFFGGNPALTITTSGLLTTERLVLAGQGIRVSGAPLEVNQSFEVQGGYAANLQGALSVGSTVTLDNLAGTGGSSFVMVGNGGVLSRGAASSLRYKENVKSLDRRAAEALLQVDTITWQYKDRETHGDRRYAGVPAEQLDELGLGLFVDYDDEGRPDQVRYWELTAPLIALCQSQQAQIDDLTARLDALEAS